MRGPNHQVAFLSALAFTNIDPSQRRMLHNSPTFLFAGPPQQIADTRNMTMDRSGAFMADQDVFVEPLPLATQKNSDNSVARTASTSSDSVATDASFLSTSESEPPLWTTKSLKSKLKVDNLPDGSKMLQSCYNKRPWIVGHRGSVYQQLENTREGFQKCAEMGADGAELDVFLLKCGTLIVFHGGGSDENAGDLSDYCDRPGNILDLTYEEAKKLSFNPKYEEFACPPEITVKGQIPTLEQVLMDAKKSGLQLKIELKGKGTVEPTVELVERLGMLDQCCFSAFDHKKIALLRTLRPDRELYRTGALFVDVPEDYLARAKAAGATEVHLRYDTCTPEKIAAIHAAGFASMAWFRGPISMASDCRENFLDVGNEDESMYDALLRTGVQQMCVNKPDVLLGLRAKLNQLEETTSSDSPPALVFDA